MWTRLVVVGCLVVGCGGDDSGGGGDAGDGPDADTSGDATVVTQAALFGGTVGGPVGDIDLISMLPNNTVLATGKTDAAGNATIRVYPGGTVTAVYQHTADMGADLITYVGVQPGDTLTFGSRQFQTPIGTANPDIGSQTYQWPLQAGVTVYNVFSSCNSAGAGAASTSVVMSELALCHKEPMDVMFVGSAAGVVTHFGFKADVNFSSGGTVLLNAWQAAQTATVNLTGLPADITNLSASWASVLDDTNEFSFANALNGAPTGGAFSGTFAFHPTGNRTMATVALTRPGFQTMRIQDSLALTSLTHTVAAPTFPPFVQTGVLSSSALRMASWFLVPDAGSVHDGQVLRLSWNHTIAGAPHPHQWHFILPPDHTAIVFPKLPAAFDEHLPFAQDNLTSQLRVFDVASLADYDAVRAQPSRNIMCIDCALRGGDFQHAVYTP